MRALIVLVPAGLAVLAAVALAHTLPVAASAPGVVLWWTGVLGGSIAVLLVAERAARRFLPLAALLELSLLFPGRAPSRLRLSRQAMTGSLSEQLERAVALSDTADPELVTEVSLGLVAALTRHDKRTRGHSERVHLFTDLIAREMDIGEEDRGRLRWAAMLHDVGKLVVPGGVLNKPAPPDDDEWAVLQRHPEVGDRLIAPLRPWLGPWADTVVEHHERYDGSGYPAGLVGEEISLGARIVAVADAYEAMTATRSYRTPLTAGAAREELASCAGRQFDPAVVRAFLQASVARLRWLVGPLAVLMSVPVVGRATTAARNQAGVVAAGGGIAVLAVAGVVPLPGAPTEPVAAHDDAIAEAGDTGERTAPHAPRDPRARTPGPGRAEAPTAPHGPVDDRGPDPTPDPRTDAAPEPPPEPTDPEPADPGPDPTPDPRTDAAPEPAPEPADPEPDPPDPEPDEPEPDEPEPDEPEPDEPEPGPGPHAVDDHAETVEGEPVTVDVLANDDVDREHTSFEIIVDPQGGTVRINPDRTVTYTPDDGFVGQDRFRYRLCASDRPGRCSTATVTIDVHPRS